MENTLNTLKTYVSHIFIEGNAKSYEIARATLIIAIPVVTLCLAAMRHIGY